MKKDKFKFEISKYFTYLKLFIFKPFDFLELFLNLKLGDLVLFFITNVILSYTIKAIIQMLMSGNFAQTFALTLQLFFTVPLYLIYSVTISAVFYLLNKIVGGKAKFYDIFTIILALSVLLILAFIPLLNLSLFIITPGFLILSFVKKLQLHIIQALIIVILPFLCVFLFEYMIGIINF